MSGSRRGGARPTTGRAGHARQGALPIQLEPIQPQELAITLVGAYVRPDPRPVWSGGIVKLLEEFGFSQSAARAALSRLVVRGYLRRVRDGRRVFYEITNHCEEVLVEGDQRIFSLGSNRSWDGAWTVVWHLIPKRSRRKRDRFGRRLRFLGFGSVQDGTWISPHDREREVTTVVDELGIASHVGVLIGKPAAELQIDRVIERSWDLDALSRRYERFVREFEHYADGSGPDLPDRDAFLVRTSLVHAFRQFPFLDPDLPDELMPSAGARSRAVSVFGALYSRLGEPAQRHFDSVAVNRAGT